QVFVAHEGDHYRTRLTHSLEVAQIARSIAHALRLDSDLAETVALAHDLGHPPFGHAGEDELQAQMAPWGGFDHNVQTFRVVTKLEERYPAFDGLNLSWETVEGVVKHNGPVSHRLDEPAWKAIADYAPGWDLRLDSFASLEAQAAAIADDIAYNTHDLDDGLRAGLIDIADLGELDLAGSILDDVQAAYPGIDHGRMAHEILRRHITRMVEDVIGTAFAGIADLAPADVDAVRAAARPLVTFSPLMDRAVKQTRKFLFQRVYRNDHVMRVMQTAEGIVEDLFARLFERPDLMPGEWSRDADRLPEEKRARRVADYLSGMTDTYALSAHRRLFDATPQLR
ncbi:MAG TPA: deoxyguanosinetriphosphate triphosphohydrolase, partial [Aurantimonas sp.]